MDNYKTKLELLVGESIENFDEMMDICNYLFWSRIENLTLTFTPSSSDYDYCRALGDTKLYHTSYGLSELWHLASTNLLKELLYHS